MSGLPWTEHDSETVRLWLDGEDFGTMCRRRAEQIAVYHARRYPEESVLITATAPGDPDFLDHHAAS